jgi:hypothetical protein
LRPHFHRRPAAGAAALRRAHDPARACRLPSQAPLIPKPKNTVIKKPTPKVVAENIAWLKANKAKIPRYNAWGDDNWAKIEAELEVLEQDLSEEEIDNRSHFEDEDDADAEDDSKDWTFVQRESAQFTRQWLDGDEDIPPSENWSGLVGKPVPRAISAAPLVKPKKKARK